MGVSGEIFPEWRYDGFAMRRGTNSLDDAAGAGEVFEARTYGIYLLLSPSLLTLGYKGVVLES